MFDDSDSSVNVTSYMH